MNTGRSLRRLAALLVLGVGALAAEELDLAEIPAGLPATKQIALEAKRIAIQHDWNDFLQQRAGLVAQYGGAKAGTPEAAVALQRKAGLKRQADQVVEAADKFNEHVERWEQWLAFDRQLGEIPKQLSGLGFTHANHDFAWYQGQSGQARDQMIARLVTHLGTYAAAKSEAALQDHFLEHIQKMKVKDVNRLAEIFVRLHLRNHEFQSWLRAFSPKASRAVLVEGAKLAIDAVKREQDIFKIMELVGTDSIADRQEAFLTVVSLLVDYPGIKELKAMATGLYDVGEAWATIVVLDRGIDELMASTEIQLVNQKRLILRQQKLMAERKRLTTELAGYP